jgi:hypothetical protein
MCGTCGHHLTVTLDGSQWDAPAPECPQCAKAPMGQEFKLNIGGSNYARAQKITEDILANDYHVANIERSPSRTKLEYKGPDRSTWGVAREALEGAIAAGRQTRIRHGSGLDILQQNLKSGAEPDLIEISKRRAMKVW